VLLTVTAYFGQINDDDDDDDDDDDYDDDDDDDDDCIPLACTAQTLLACSRLL